MSNDFYQSPSEFDDIDDDDFANDKFQEVALPQPDETAGAAYWLWRGSAATINNVDGTIERARQLADHKNVLRSPAQMRECITLGGVYGLSRQPFDGPNALALLFVSDATFPTCDSVHRHNVRPGTPFNEFFGPLTINGLPIDFMARLIQVAIVCSCIRGGNLGLTTDKAGCWFGDPKTEMVLRSIGQNFICPKEEWPRSANAKIRSLDKYFDDVTRESPGGYKQPGLVFWNRDTIFDDAEIVRKMITGRIQLSDGRDCSVLLPGHHRNQSLELIDDIINREGYVLDALFGRQDVDIVA